MSPRRDPVGIAELRPGASGSGARARRSATPVHWIEGGPLAGWTAAGPRSNRRLPAREPVREPAFRFALTEVADPSRSEAIRRWTEEQRLLVVLPEQDEPPPRTVFWRLAVNRRAIALGALPCPNVEIAVGRIRRVARRASRLQVSLAFLAGQITPRWVIHDDGAPVLIGLPDQQLVATTDPETSVARMLATATVERYIHHAGDAPR